MVVCLCFSNWRDLFLFSGRTRVLPDLQVAGHYRATGRTWDKTCGQALQSLLRPSKSSQPFKVFSGLQLQSPFFQSPKVNFLCCRGSQMPIKWCKMFYRSFKTNFCITFLLQLYRGKTFSCKLISGWEFFWSHDWTWTVVYVVKLHDINTAT